MRGFFVRWHVFQVLEDLLLQDGVEDTLPAVQTGDVNVPQELEKAATAQALGEPGALRAFVFLPDTLVVH